MKELFILQKRIKYILSLIILFAVIFHLTCASAEQKGINYRSVLKFCSGIVTAFSFHELSHAVVAELTNTEIHWEIGTLNQPIGFTENASSDPKGMALNSAGLVTEAIGSEIILRGDGINKNDPFVQGFMTWNILNPIFYSLDYWLFRKTNKEEDNLYQGDLEGIEHYTNEATAQGFALSMSAIAIFQGYRFLKTQSWAPDWLKAKSHSMNLEPASSGGFLLEYKFLF